MIEVLPCPPDTRAASDEHSEEAAEDAANDEDELETVTTDAREESSEPERAQQPQEEPRLPPRCRAPPVRYESEEWTRRTRHSAHMSTTMWSESAEPRTYTEAVNHPLNGKEWELAIKEEYDSLMRNGACVTNGVLVSTLIRLGFSGTPLKPPRIFMYLSLQQFILSNLVLVLRRPWLVLRPSRLILQESWSCFRVPRDSLRNSMGACRGTSRTQHRHLQMGLQGQEGCGRQNREI